MVFFFCRWASRSLRWSKCAATLDAQTSVSLGVAVVLASQWHFRGCCKQGCTVGARSWKAFCVFGPCLVRRSCQGKGLACPPSFPLFAIMVPRDSIRHGMSPALLHKIPMDSSRTTFVVFNFLRHTVSIATKSFGTSWNRAKRSPALRRSRVGVLGSRRLRRRR